VVNYVDIEKTLNDIDSQYSNSMSQNSLPIILSKAALIEFSGWLEQSLDQILDEYLDYHVCDAKIVDFIKKQIKRNHGFNYDKILKMLSVTIGAYNLENVLDRINVNSFQTLVDKYSSDRNKAAHTHTAGTTQTYDAPSSILKDFQSIRPIIATLEREIKSLP